MLFQKFRKTVSAGVFQIGTGFAITVHNENSLVPVLQK